MAQISNITWNITNIRTLAQSVPNQPNYITMCSWLATATDGTNTTTLSGSWEFPVINNHPSFLPFETLTEEQIVGWMHQTMPVENVIQALQKQLDLLASPPEAPAPAPLPWANS